MASGAGRLLDEAGHFDRVEDALSDAYFVLPQRRGRVD